MRGIMVDTETLGTSPGCVILSIGACEFDDNDILGTFHVHIDVEDSAKRGLAIDARTVLWWLSQSKEAQEAISNAQVFGLEQALCELESAFDWEDKRVWCQGAAFDFPIVGAAFKLVDRQVPWAYYNERDMRTVKGMITKDEWRANHVPPTIKHDALADAISQAKTLQNIMRQVDAGLLKWAA